MIIRKGSVLYALAIGALVSTGAVGIATANAQGFGRGNGDSESAGTEQRRNGSGNVEREAGCQENLAKVVSDGKLTEVQRKLLLEKRDAIRTKRKSDHESWKNLTRSQRQEKVKTRRAELERWAKDNGIDVRYLFLGDGRGEHARSGGDRK